MNKKFNILVPTNWKTVDLCKEEDENLFGEALRNYCFVGNCMDTGCYSTFEVIPHLKKITATTRGWTGNQIFEEAKTYLWEDITPTVYHYKIEEKDCWLNYEDSDYDHPQKLRISDPYEIVCAWTWDHDGALYLRFNNKAVVNYDCKKDYTWKWC